MFEAAFTAAVPVITTATGYCAHQLHPCIDLPGRYLLIIHWQSLTDHTVRFRQSPEYGEWRRFIDRFCAREPLVEHFAGVPTNAAVRALPAP